MPYLRAALPCLLVALATLAAYANAWPDALVLDDKLFAGHERFADLSRLPEFFRESVWAAGGATELLYRPLLMVSVAFDAALFGDRLAAWHGVNVALHVAVTLLVYLLLVQLLRRTDGGEGSAVFAALLAALVFGVHPLHTEVVNSIFNRSSLLAALACVGGLWWLLRHLDARPALAWAGIWLAYWVALFSRETGIVLPALAAWVVWIHSAGPLPAKIRRCLPVLLMLLPMAVYLVLRARAITPPTPLETAAASDLAAAAGSGRIFEWRAVPAAAGVWLDALRVAVWPRPLLVFHWSPSQALQVAGLIVHPLLLGTGLFLYRRKRPGLLTGLVFFYVALLPSSRLIGSDGLLPHLAERYLYLPSVGLAILLAFALRALLRRGDRLLAAAPVVLALFLLTPLTWARNEAWSNEVRLLEQDYRNGARSYTLLRLLTGAYLLQGQTTPVVELCGANESLRDKHGQLSVHCGTAYALSGDAARAEQAFIDATGERASRTRAHSNLARLYLSQERRNEARRHFQLAIETEENPSMRAYREGLMLLQLYPADRARLLQARTHFEAALQLQPRQALALAALAEVEQKLDQAGGGDQP